MSDEIKAAAERFSTRMLAGFDGSGGPPVWTCRQDEPYPDDVHRSDVGILARAYLAAEAAREAEQAEREKGINEEWLLSIGFTKQISDGATFILISSRWHEVEIIGGCVYLAPKNGTFIRVGTALTTTRGMMLDFLSSLKIPTKQQQ